MKRTNPFAPIYNRLNNVFVNAPLHHLLCIDIEVTNYCNLSCLMCPTGTKSSSRKQGYMSDDVFYKIVNEIKGSGIGLRFIRWGEPLLHPRINKYIAEAKKHGLLCHVNTNGMLCDKDMSLSLMSAGLDSIKFSFQGADETSYHEMRQGGDFKKLLENIKTMYDLRGSAALPYMHIATTTTYESVEQIDNFKSMVSDRCDLVTVGKTKMEHINVDMVKISDEQKDKLIELKQKELVVKKRLKVCPEVYGKLSINWDGQVTACCSDYDCKMIVGDIRDNSLEEIFHCNKLNAYRDTLCKNEFEKIPFCSRCFDLMGIQS